MRKSGRRRILYYLDCPCAGGANLLGLYLVREIAETGDWDVSIVYRQNAPFQSLLDRLIPASIPRTRVPFPERVEWIDSFDERVGNRLLRLAVRAALRAMDAVIFPLEFLILLALLRRRKPDLVHINNGGYPGALGCRAAALAAGAAGIPVVMNVHNQARPWSLLDGPTDRLVEASVGAFITSSMLANEALGKRGFFKGKISSIRNGIPRPAANGATDVRKELGLSPEHVVWVVTAWFEPRKGQAVLVEAIKRLKDRGALPSQLRVLFIGTGVEKADVEHAVRAAGVTGTVQFLGYRADAIDVLNAADGLILPSLHSEDMPLIVLDAMALAKPVIASSLQGIAEEVEDGLTGLLVPPGDPDALGVALANLSADPDRRRELGMAGLARFQQHFDIAGTYPRYSQLYKQLLQEETINA